MILCSRPELQMQQDRNDSSNTSRHISSDIAHAERVLLDHAKVRSTATGGVNLVQHAQQLIIYLQQHAQQSQGVLAIATSEDSQAHPATLPLSILESALDASAKALRTMFDGNLLSELCAILYTLYVRQACLDASPGPLTAPVHALDHDSMPIPEDCQLAADSINLGVTSSIAQQQQHSALPHCMATAPKFPQQHTGTHEQAPADFHETAAFRYVPLFFPHSVCGAKAWSAANER